MEYVYLPRKRNIFFDCFQQWITKGSYKNSLSIIIIASNEFSTILFILIEINSLNRIKDNYLIALIFLFLFVRTKS